METGYIAAGHFDYPLALVSSTREFKWLNSIQWLSMYRNLSATTLIYLEAKNRHSKAF